MRKQNAVLSLVLTVAIGGLHGCMVGPDYQTPQVQTPETWRTDTAEVMELADSMWWNRFNDPVLDALIDEALRNNYDVRIAASRVEEFSARLGITRSAAFPQVGYDGSAGSEKISGEIGTGKLASDRTSDFFTANLNVGWELDLWGRIARSTEAARADLLANEEARRGVVLSLVTAVAQSYVGLRSLDQQLAFAETVLETRADNLELFEKQLEHGIISKLEVAQVRSEYERTAATIPGIRRDIALLENSLSVLLGRPPGPIERGKALEMLDLPAIPSGLPSDLLRRRPDLRRNEQQLIAANARIGAAIAEFYPSISLTGVLGVASDDLSNLSKSSAGLYQLAASVTGPIFTAGRLKGQVQVSEAQQQQALDTYLQSILTALREADDALVTYQMVRDEVDALGRQVESLKVYSELANKRFDNGYVGYIEVLDSERDLFDAQLQLVRLEATQYTAVINIYKAFGGGWVELAEEVADTQTPEQVDAIEEPEDKSVSISNE